MNEIPIEKLLPQGWQDMLSAQLSSANCIQQCINNVQTNLQQVDNVLTQRLNINFKKL